MCVCVPPWGLTYIRHPRSPKCLGSDQACCAPDETCDLDAILAKFRGVGWRQEKDYHVLLPLVLAVVRHQWRWNRSGVEACLGNSTALSACLAPSSTLGLAARTLFAADAQGLTQYGRELVARLNSTLAGPHSARDECNACAVATRPQFAPDTECLPASCAGCRCACFSALGALAPSLYRVQIEHCLEHVDRSRFLFVDYAELVRDHVGVMNRVAAHAGLAPFNFSRVTPAMANERFDASYPKFKTITGWNVLPDFNGSVLPRDIVQRLRAYFASDSAFSFPSRRRRVNIFVNFKADSRCEHWQAAQLRKLTGLALAEWD